MANATRFSSLRSNSIDSAHVENVFAMNSMAESENLTISSEERVLGDWSITFSNLSGFFENDLILESGLSCDLRLKIESTEKALALFVKKIDGGGEAEGRHGDYIVLSESEHCEEDPDRQENDKGESSSARLENFKKGRSPISKDGRSGYWTLRCVIARYIYCK